jgi:hypothetical protein
MPLTAIRSYAERLPELLAVYREMMIEAATFPHMTEANRWATMVRLEAYSERVTPARRATSAELRSIGIADVSVQSR